MQSVLLYGRLLTRALVSGVYGHTPTSSDVNCVNRKRDLKFLIACCGFPKVWTGFTASLLRRGQFGDDACFVAKYKTTDVLGVADGVGGWRTYGVDPSQFSSSLMRTCERLVLSGRFNPQSPAGIIAASYYELLENKEHIIGSSTACVLVLNRDNSMLYTANIGDSGFLIIRQGQIVHRSEEQQHYFNTPFQLSLPPPSISRQVHNDSPELAETSSFVIQEGDLILLATDGLFDNLPDNMIVQHLSKLRDRNLETIQQSVNSLAFQAHRLAFDSNYLSPFAINARANGIDATGGKPDDITVILISVGPGWTEKKESARTAVSQSSCIDYG